MPPKDDYADDFIKWNGKYKYSMAGIDESYPLLQKPTPLRRYRTAIEIPMFAFFFTYSMSESIISNLILYRTCTVTLGYNQTLCNTVIASKDSNETKEIEEILQSHSSTIIMAKSLVEGIFPALISLFLGPWSDKNGRKPMLVASTFGYFTYFCIAVGYALLEDLDPWYIIVAVVPFSLLGGSASLITGSFCYTSDVSETNNRSFRMSILECSLLMGVLLGSICSSYALAALSYGGVFAMCSLINIMITFYCLFILKESVIYNATFSKFFDFNLIKEMLHTCSKQRLCQRRTMIWLVMFACVLGIFVLQGDTALNYLFTRERLNWKLKDFTFFIAFSIITCIIGVLIVAFVFQKCLKMRDGFISIISYTSNIIRSVLVAFSTETWHMYLGACISALRGVSAPVNRAILTKLVPPEEAGKVLSLTTSLETIIPLISSPIYTYLYKKTLSVFPGAYNLLSAYLYFVCIVLLGIVEYLLLRGPENGYVPI